MIKHARVGCKALDTRDPPRPPFCPTPPNILPPPASGSASHSYCMPPAARVHRHGALLSL